MIGKVWEGKRREAEGRGKEGKGRKDCESLKKCLYRGTRLGGNCSLGNALYLSVMPVLGRLLL